MLVTKQPSTVMYTCEPTVTEIQVSNSFWQMYARREKLLLTCRKLFGIAKTKLVLRSQGNGFKKVDFPEFHDIKDILPVSLISDCYDFRVYYAQCLEYSNNRRMQQHDSDNKK